MAGSGLRPVLLPGPWQHLDVSAHGIRLHAALGAHLDPTRPLVVLLHGFAQHWWAWRHVLPALDAAGYAAAALDLRGCGGSDQTPRGYDLASTAADVSGLVRALGFARAVLVGHGGGSRAAWATAAYAPEQVRAVAVVAAPHPADRRHRLRPLRGVRTPVLPERRISAEGARWVEQHLRGLTADPDALSPADVAPYRAALRAWPGPRGTLAPLRLDARSPRGLREALRGGTAVPLLLVRGTSDPLVPAAALERTRAYARGPVAVAELPGVGHLVPEEDPAALSRTLLDWLDTLPPASG